MSWLGLDWGNVPSWVGTLVTGGSATVAARGYLHSVRNKEREQIAQFSCWIKFDVTNRRFILHVRNASHASLHRVSVIATGWDSGKESPEHHINEHFVWSPLGPETEHTAPLTRNGNYAIPPMWQVMDSLQRYWCIGGMGEPPRRLRQNGWMRRMLGLRWKTHELDPPPLEDQVPNPPWWWRLTHPWKV